MGRLSLKVLHEMTQEQSQPTRQPSQRVTQRSALLALVMIAIRLLLASQHAPLVLDDSAGYAWNGSHTIRPYGISALFSLCGRPEVIVVVQTLVSTGCWLWLLFSLRRALSTFGHVSATVVGIVALLSLSWPVVMWDRTILSESLTLGLMAATVAAGLDLRAKAWDRRTQLVFLFLLVAGALVREITLVTFMLPIAAMLVLSHRQRFRGLVGLAVMGGTLSSISFIPASQPYFQPNLTMTSFRNLVIINCRVLPDPYLKARLERIGMPKGSDKASQTCGTASDDAMTRFATDFPFGQYVVAEATRPATFVRYVAPGIDRSTLNQLGAYGSFREPAPLVLISLAVWHWSSAIHTVFTALIGICAIVFWRKGSHPADDLPIANALPAVFISLALSLLGCAGAALAVLGSSRLESGRHAAPFLIASRMSLVVAAVLMASVANVRRRTWTRSVSSTERC
jgi:hypothetical protein